VREKKTHLRSDRNNVTKKKNPKAQEARFTYVKCFLVNRIEHFEAVVGRCFLISIYLNNSNFSSVLLCMPIYSFVLVQIGSHRQ